VRKPAEPRQCIGAGAVRRLHVATAGQIAVRNVACLCTC
jgi:hypothetical protein